MVSVNLTVAAHSLLPRTRIPCTNPTGSLSPQLTGKTWLVSPCLLIQDNPILKLHGWTMSHVKEDGEREQLTSCKQQGKQHEEHRRGLCSVITSWPRLSIIRRVKGRDGPQQFLVQQSVSSAAKYTLCPTVFLISYLFCASKPVKTEKIGTELLNFCSASGQKSANSKATLREGRPRSQSVRGSYWRREAVGKDPQAEQPDGEVQRGEATMKMATQKGHGDVHQSPPTRHGHLLPEQAPQL